MIFSRKDPVRSDIPNDSCFQAWKHSDSKCADCIVEKTFQDGKSHQDEKTVVMKDGRKVQLLLRTTPVKDAQDRIVYVLETAVDITENTPPLESTVAVGRQS